MCDLEFIVGALQGHHIPLAHKCFVDISHATDATRKFEWGVLLSGCMQQPDGALLSLHP